MDKEYFVDINNAVFDKAEALWKSRVVFLIKFSGDLPLEKMVYVKVNL